MGLADRPVPGLTVSGGDAGWVTLVGIEPSAPISASRLGRRREPAMIFSVVPVLMFRTS